MKTEKSHLTLLQIPLSWLVEAFRTFLVSPDANMIALLDGRGIGFDSP
jgi:hypothetical protein